jgi:hypothetical protein
MKISGRKFGVPEKWVVFPRNENEALRFKVKAVINFDVFAKLFPSPTPPIKTLPGGIQQLDVTDKDYKDSVQKWAEAKMHWMTLQSLSATPDLEWETVKDSDPTTWGNYQTELSEALTPGEIRHLIDQIVRINGLNEEAIERATNDFLATLAAANVA